MLPPSHCLVDFKLELDKYFNLALQLDARSTKNGSPILSREHLTKLQGGNQTTFWPRPTHRNVKQALSVLKGAPKAPQENRVYQIMTDTNYDFSINIQ